MLTKLLFAVFQIMCVFSLVNCEQIRVKLIIFTRITVREESSHIKSSLFKTRFLLFEKKFKVKLFYGNEAKIISSYVKCLSIEIDSYNNECVSSNILEKQDRFPPDKRVHEKLFFKVTKWDCCLPLLFLESVLNNMLICCY